MGMLVLAGVSSSLRVFVGEAANRMAVNRAIESLSKKEKIGLSENYVWLSEHIEH